MTKRSEDRVWRADRKDCEKELRKRDSLREERRQREERQQTDSERDIY